MNLPSPPQVALVAGASGIVGAGIAQQLVAQGWQVICASRSGGGGHPGTEGLAIDLLKPSECVAALLQRPSISHVFYAAYQQCADRTAEVEVNVAMLKNLVDAANTSLTSLHKIVLVTGAKIYGIQWSENNTPCRESDPRQLPPNFYYGQEDCLREASKGRGWSWVNLIPPLVSGYALGNPMNVVLGIGIYAAVCKELGIPLRFPGTPSAYRALHQFADARQIGAAAAWAATSGAAANEAFNVANGDPARWSNTWPAIAQSLAMPSAETKTTPLAEMMPHQQPLWNAIARREGLRPVEIGKIVDWTWMDFILRMPHDMVLETGKIRRAGFHDCIETELAFSDRLAELRRNRVLP